jgi:hypothetical protein
VCLPQEWMNDNLYECHHTFHVRNNTVCTWYRTIALEWSVVDCPFATDSLLQIRMNGKEQEEKFKVDVPMSRARRVLIKITCKGTLRLLYLPKFSKPSYATVGAKCRGECCKSWK